MQEAALLGVLETVRQAIQTFLSTQAAEALEGMNMGSTDIERRFMNQVLTGKLPFECLTKLRLQFLCDGLVICAGRVAVARNTFIVTDRG